MMRKKQVVIVSILISALAHGVFLTASYFVWVPGASEGISATERLFEIKAVDVPSHPVTRQVISKGYIQSLKFEKPAEGIEEKITHHLMEPAFLEAPEPAVVTKESVALAERNLEPPEMPLPELKEAIHVGKRPVLTKERLLSPDLLRSAEGPRPESSFLRIPKEFAEQMPSFTPARATPETARPLSERESFKKLPGPVGEEAFSPNPAYEPLDAFLNANLLTYRDPADGQGYFQLAIYPSPRAKELEVMPKEIIFLVDASLSIQKKRLHAFKEGIKYALNLLNPDDRFNVYVFRDKILPFAQQSVLPNDSTLLAAMRFLDHLYPTHTTDIYSALYQTIEHPPSLSPSYIVLLSDGNPTRGVVSSARLIAELTRKNGRKRPIFAFSGGPRINRFLLDFLVYPNRGWTEYARDNSQIQERFKEFYDKIRNPVLVNVRYQVTPLKADEVYPKNLPDFYRDAVFTLYGRFRDEKLLAIRILGELGKTTKEFIFSGDLTQAAKGSRDIARFWAFNKVYHLISQQILKGASAADKQLIRELIDRFDLEIPYEFEEML